MIEENDREYYKLIVALLTAITTGDEQSVASIIEEVAGDEEFILHFAAFSTSTIVSLLEEIGVDLQTYLTTIGRHAAVWEN